MPLAGSTLARSERTRATIVEAMLDLLAAGNLAPSAAEITDQAGISRRSLYVHFADLEALYDAASERQIARVAPHFERLRFDGDLGGRIDAFVSVHADVWEAVSPVRRAALRIEPQSPVVARRLHWTYTQGRRQIEKVFAPELRGRPDRRDLLAAIDVAASWLAWEHLRRNSGLSIVAARRVVARQLRSLLQEDDN